MGKFQHETALAIRELAAMDIASEEVPRLHSYMQDAAQLHAALSEVPDEDFPTVEESFKSLSKVWLQKLERLQGFLRGAATRSCPAASPRKNPFVEASSSDGHGACS